MKKLLKRLGLVLLLALIIVQFIRPTRNISEGAQPNDIAAHYTVPDNVMGILKKACYDCHSNNTRYPWYTNIQPAGLWMQHHVDEGKHELNFSEFFTYKKKKKLKRLGQTSDAVTEGWMPLSSYTLIHKDAKLTKEEAAAVSEWADALADKIDETEPDDAGQSSTQK